MNKINMNIEFNYDNWIKSYLFEWFWKVSNVKEWVPYVWLKRIIKHLESWTQPTFFDNERSISLWVYSRWYSLIEYSSKETRDIDEKLFDEKFKKVKVIMSESYENDRQIPEATWSFEYNWKFYLTIYNCNPLTEEINEKLWVFKWMILNPQKYFEVQNELEKVSDKVWDILENEK